MTRSYRTDHPSRVAKRRVLRDARGNPLLPRIIERKPRRGDIHPLPKFFIGRMIPDIPIEYLYGLRYIELRARENKSIGKPFAFYDRADRIMVLYSLPLEWSLNGISEPLEQSVRRCYGTIVKDDGSVTVTWPRQFLMNFWFFDYVFCHELGHHFSEQYRHRQGRVEGRFYREAVADLRGMRVSRDWWKQMRKRREQRLKAASRS